MNKAKPPLHLTLLAAAGLFGMSSPALAYLDPGTGSMLISAIVGILATAILAIKTFWYKLRSFLRPGKSPSREPATTSDEQDDAGR